MEGMSVGGKEAERGDGVVGYSGRRGGVERQHMRGARVRRGDKVEGMRDDRMML